MDRDAAWPPVITIEGELIALGPIRRDLVHLYQRWFNDLGTMRTLDQSPLPKTFEDELAWFDNSLRSTDPVLFTIYERAGLRPIGNTDLRNINYRSRTAEFGIVIGEADARGRGFGTETTRLVLDYAFTALGLNNVMLKVAEFNPAGRRAYEKAGFREIGRRRQARMMGGRLWDSIYMDCLASEFSSPVLAQFFKPDDQWGT